MKTLRFIVMTHPRHFDVVYKINPWMRPEEKIDKEKMLKNWENLRKTYEGFNIKVEIINQDKSLPDGVFAANGAFAYKDKAVIANFKYAQRKPEAEYYQKFFEKKGFEIIKPDFDYEGEGDSLMLDDILLQGYGIRSDKRIVDLMKKIFDFKLLPLRLINPKYYHLDTALFPLDKKLAFFVPEAFDEKSQDLIKKHLKAIPLTKEEAETFAANSILIKDTVITNTQVPASFDQKIKKLGYKQIKLEFSEFFKAGGSVKCATLEVF